jgi:MFS family permease
VGLQQLWLLYLCVALQAGSFAVSSPSRRAILPQIVRRDQIATANTLYMGEFNLALVVGPLIAGLAISAGGFALAYSVDVATFVVSLATTVIGLPRLPPVTGTPRAGLRSVVEGLRFLRGRNNLLMTFIVDIDAMVFGMPRALFPVLAVTHFHGGASTVGYLYAAPGAGALIIAVAGGWTSAIRRQGLAVALAIAVWGCSVAFFGFTHTLWIGLVLLAIAGAADAVSAIFRSTIMQVAAPAEMQGRLSGVFMVVVAGGPRLGDLESGAVAAAVSPTFSAVSGGLACLVGLALCLAAVPSFLRYDAEHPTP